jgi:hypothetical protein
MFRCVSSVNVPTRAGVVRAGGDDVQDWNSKYGELASAERDDAPNRVVWRNTDGDAIAWNDFDAEAAHPAAELCEHFVASITLHAVETAAMHRHNRTLHVDEIVLAQIARNPFSSTL